MSVFRYEDADGNLLGEKRRLPLPDGGKLFTQSRVAEGGEEVDTSHMGVLGTRKAREGELIPGGFGDALYRLPELVAAFEAGDPETAVVYLTEGEKDADALRALGLVATTCNGRLDAWLPDFEGLRVAVVAGRDEAGCRKAWDRHDLLAPHAAGVTVLFPAVGKDVSDHLHNGLGVDDLVEVRLPAPGESGSGPEVAAETLPDADLAEALEATRELVARYISTGEHELDAIALWLAHTHVFDAFDVTPYLSITSPTKRCGKSALMRLLGLLAPRPWSAVGVSEAALFRKIEAARPTFMLDEADTLWLGKEENAQTLRGILNGGYERGGTIARCVPPKMTVVDYSVFCPKVLAGIGHPPDTIRDRSIEIEMRRKAKGEQVARLRMRRARAEAQPVRDSLAGWAAHADRDALAAAEVEDILELSDRDVDIWEPLLLLADEAEGDWPERALAAATGLSGGVEEDDAVGVQLLLAIRDAFGDREQLSTASLVAKLQSGGDTRWSMWDATEAPRKMAYHLKPFGVSPGYVHEGDGEGRKTARGYRRADLEDAWQRYLA